ncbi:hypothetical protein [Cellulomonas xylanilytica]|uniref:Uncharacterized protein n=1 Tax=Cellulomonas xylanilytica TaxID=233583 RepID=A0A510V8B9_9CELL|nr:hypothetical protein [Cellulomonas xylanilytica]GEK21510.1 hypothetical protein CXY01_20300 [Cellulomonas xylanilytica]
MTQPLDLAALTGDAVASDARLTAPVAGSEHPLVLLPVRLETRYRDAELLVRVYPDQLHVDAHDPRLSAQEIAAGEDFWRVQWRTGTDRDRAQRAYTALADRYGPGRAAWVVRATTPTNPQARPEGSVADDAPLSTEPTFPVPETTDLRSTPVARLLPTRWTATAYAQGAVVAVVTGSPIIGDLAVGPDLSAPLVHAEDDDEVAAVDRAMSWLVDFDTAEQVGMALRLPVPGPVDLLLVAGVREGGPDGSVARLLDAQRYSEGLAFLEPETLTNNTEDVASGWSSAAPGSWPASSAPPEPGTAAALARSALGLAGPADLAALPAGASADDPLAEAMSTTLWPATWGYWLPQLAGVALADADWVRDHARRFVRPAGPLPTLRVGRQPYGLLPVTSLGRFAGDEREDRLRRVLAGLVDGAWRPALGRAPRVGRGDVAADLVDVLRLGARSDRVRLRRAFGARFAEHVQLLLGRRLGEAGFWDVAGNRSLPLAAAAGVGLRPAALTVHEPDSRPVTVPLVGHPALLRDLLTADVDQLAAGGDDAPPSLLAALVRHGLLRENATAAARLLGPEAPDVTDEELDGFGEPTAGWRAQRDATLPDGATVRERLAAGTDPHVAAFRAAVEVLAAADPAALERHLLGTLDAATYRIDAWTTSLASRRLAELRAVQAQGALVGGYGWSEQLSPTAAGVLTETPPGEPGPLLAGVDDPGFLHAPSIHQAQVAALLRNAHLAHGGGTDTPFAISLTSERVRLARSVLDGVRAGRTVNVVLGYLVERDLHDRGLDKAIDNAREVSPLPGEEHLPPAARRLDGLSLHALWAASEDHAIDHLVGGDPSEADRAAAQGVLRRLGSAVDAAADLLQAEQVHQLALGDLDRAVSTVTDFDRGLVPPPDLDVVQTPRTGVAVTHRVGIVLDPAASAAPGWTGPARSPRAAAEPGLDAWLGRVLGPATGRTVSVRDAAGDVVLPVPLPDLDLSASDLVRLAGAGEHGLAELAARAAVASGDDVLRPVVVLDGPLLDLLEVGRSLAALLGPATPMDGGTLQPPHADTEPGVDGAELDARVAAARAAVQGAVELLDAALSDPARLQDAVVGSWSLGVGDAAVPVETTPSGWAAAAARAREQLRGRLAEAGAAGADPSGPSWTAALRRLRVLLGPGFVALPRFVPSTAADVVASRDHPALLGGDQLAVEVWLTRMERVREPLGRLGIALREAEVLGGPAFAPGAAQVPFRSGDVWNALPADHHVDGAVSLALVGAELVAPDREVAGLLVDEWTEVVPSASETTGVAFRYDPPDLMAPQAILLAVPPVVGEPWTLGTLNQVLVETLEQVHLRAVPPSTLGAVRQYLPATVLAFNADRDAVSTSPNALTGVD